MAVSRHEIQKVSSPLVLLIDGRGRQIFSVVTTLLALLALSALMSTIVAWGQVKLDDVRYGRPRTFHMTTSVNNGESVGVLTHFIAMNLDRQVVVLEIPDGDVAQARTLMGPYLFGSGEDLTPVTLRMEDVNRDGAQDLVLQVKDEEIVYLYRDGAFSLITTEERQQLLVYPQSR